MGRTKWTAEQRQVIEARGKNLLVSAAAGSGKTAVLVERILGLVTDPVHPTDIDRLLVVTFTRAAAAEMRDRIGKALSDRLQKDPDNAHLQKQGVLLGHAQITTIDGFCGFVIQNYYQRIGIDPGYTVADEGELSLLRADVMDRMLEEEYAAGSPLFLQFVDSYAPGKSDAAIEDIIFRVFDFAMTDPFPDAWLDACLQTYEVQTADELEQTPWMQDLMESVRARLAEIEKTAEDCLEEAATEFPRYVQMFADDLDALRGLEHCGTFREMQAAFQGKVLKKATTIRSYEEGERPEIKEKLKTIRDKKIRDAVQSLQKTYFSESAEELLDEMHALGPVMGELVRLVRRFGELFREAKRKKNQVDFNDLEHYAMDILLVRDDDGQIRRTDAAKELAGRFDEVMIDEYQDSNYLQERILDAVSGCADGRNDRFMVGDIKQSIYSFRKARPELFLEKYQTYQKLPSDADSIRIDLGKNFRSRRSVLDVTNAFFQRLMIPEVGGVSYDADQALYPGADYVPCEVELNDPETEEGASIYPFPEAEMLLIDREAEDFDADRSAERMMQAEALAVANRIKELKETGRIQAETEAGEKYLRTIDYRDIVILLRTGNQWADVFVKVLQQEGIPAYATSKTGYFSAPEIVVIMNYLRIVDNPRQDIPLASVLRSPIGGLSDRELALIRGRVPQKEKRSFYDAVLAFQADPDAGVRFPETRRKLDRFFRQLSDMRERAVYTEVHRLIGEILTETGYGAWASAMPAGQQREANLKMLLEKAAAYEKTSYHGLFNFIRYIEKLQKYEIDYGEVNVFGEAEDTVRVMTIHKSKGLQFPVVFVSGLGKQFNDQDARGQFALHADLGIGADFIDLQKRTRQKGFYKGMIQQRIRRDSRGEELRVLYVAMTRAKEKLILTGTVRKGEALEEALALQHAAGIQASKDGKTDGWSPAARRPLAAGDLLAAGSCIEWLLQTVPGPELLHIHRVGAVDLAQSEEKEARRRSEILADLAARIRDPAAVDDAQVRAFLAEKHAWQYPYRKAASLPAKLTVSEIKKMSTEAMGEEKGEELFAPAPETEEEETYVPAFMRENGKEEAAGAARGTIYHRFLECLDYGRMPAPPAEESGRSAGASAARNPHGADGAAENAVLAAYIRSEIRRMTDEGLLTQADAECLRPRALVTFLVSGIGRRMKRASDAGRLRREQPFVIDIPAADIDKDWPEDENILVQGTIDAYFSENGKYILVDYKTDRVTDPDGSSLVERYREQLTYYQIALERITGISVAEKWIYSFGLGKGIRL